MAAQQLREGRPKIARRLADPDERHELTVARLWHLTPQQWRELPEDDRELMLAEHELVCPSCGNLRSICSDPTRDWYPARVTCYATAAREAAVRKVNKLYEKRPEVLDGVGVGVLLDDPGADDFFGGDELPGMEPAS